MVPALVWFILLPMLCTKAIHFLCGLDCLNDELYKIMFYWCQLKVTRSFYRLTKINSEEFLNSELHCDSYKNRFPKCDVIHILGKNHVTLEFFRNYDQNWEIGDFTQSHSIIIKPNLIFCKIITVGHFQ